MKGVYPQLALCGKSSMLGLIMPPYLRLAKALFPYDFFFGTFQLLRFLGLMQEFLTDPV